MNMGKMGVIACVQIWFEPALMDISLLLRKTTRSALIGRLCVSAANLSASAPRVNGHSLTAGPLITLNYPRAVGVYCSLPWPLIPSYVMSLAFLVCKIISLKLHMKGGDHTAQRWLAASSRILVCAAGRRWVEAVNRSSAHISTAVHSGRA